MPRSQIKTVLFLGLDPPKEENGVKWIHCPVIEIHPRPIEDKAIIRFFKELPSCTFGIFTSKQAVKIFFNYLKLLSVHSSDFKLKKIAAVGKATAKEIEKEGFKADYISTIETAEGVCQTIEQAGALTHSFFWPHSALSRPTLTDFFKTKNVRLNECILYDTKFKKYDLVPCLNEIDEIVFTSPSTVRGFIELFGKIPNNKILTTIGPITEKQLFLLRD